MAIVSSNELSRGIYSLVLNGIKKLTKLSDVVYAMLLEVLNADTPPLDPDLYILRVLKSKKKV